MQRRDGKRCEALRTLGLGLGLGLGFWLALAGTRFPT